MEDYCKRRTAELITRERLRHGENPRDVAYALDIDTRTYERWEAADTFPQPNNFRALSEHWKVPITDLRPDLKAEQSQLNRIEGKLDAVIAFLGASSSKREAVADLERALEEIAQLPEVEEHGSERSADGPQG